MRADLCIHCDRVGVPCDGSCRPTYIHTIPVDPALTPGEAWKEICVFGRRVTWTGAESWVNVECDGEECRSIEGWPGHAVHGMTDEAYSEYLGQHMARGEGPDD